MEILSAELTVTDVAACAAWLRDTLELPTAVDDDRASVTLGRSTLALRPGVPDVGRHHLALSVRPEDFDAALAFARGTLEPLAARGDDVIDGPEGWDSRSVYFHGPEGLVLEYIAREAHRGRHRADVGPLGPGPRGAPAVLSLSEVGIGVADVPAAVARLGEELGLPAYPPQAAEFAPVGDVDGLLILVAPDRTWFPTDHDRPSRGELTVTLAGPAGPDLRIGEHTTVRRPG